MYVKFYSWLKSVCQCSGVARSENTDDPKIRMIQKSGMTKIRMTKTRMIQKYGKKIRMPYAHGALPQTPLGAPPLRPRWEGQPPRPTPAGLPPLDPDFLFWDYYS